MTNDLKDALAAWAEVLGVNRVLTDPHSLHVTERGTFLSGQAVPALIQPASTREVQECIAIANKFRIAIYPVSTGKNWGYGSAIPVKDGCVVMSLARMNRVIEFDERLGYVTIEPGVTQGQLYEFLRSQGSRLWMDAAGASLQCSIVGNTVERGFGHTPYGDHFSNVCGLEVVLPDGKRIVTGFGRFPNARAAGVYRWGVGPYLDGIFSQSNFGVVTQMTLWLMPAPEYFQAFYFSIEEDGQLEELIDALAPLRLDRTICSALHIGNDFKVLSSIRQFPWEESNNKPPLSADLMQRYRRRWDFGAWNGSGGLYGTRQQVAADRARIKQALKGKVKKLRFLDDRTLRIAQWIQQPYKWITGVDLPRMLKLVQPVYGLMKGIPTDSMLASTYWRKREPAPSGNMDPDRDKCGLIWCAPVSPASGKHARAMVDIVNRVFSEHQFEPAMSMTLITERSLDNVICITYDRSVPGEDQRAMACHDALLQRLTAAGYYPYRLGLQSMQKLPAAAKESSEFLRTLKKCVDPNNILAPGRYER